MKAFLTAVIISLATTFISGTDVRLEGYAPGAAGTEINVYSQPDPIMGKQSLIESVRVGSNDRFTLELDCGNYCWIVLRHGSYDFQLLVEAGSNYILQLPAYRALSKADRLNPFFNHKTVHIKLEGNENTNNLIRLIDSLYFEHAGRVTGSIYLGEKLPDRDSLLQSFSAVESSISGEYARVYFKYRAALLKIISGRKNTPGQDVIELINSSFCPRMPSCTDLVKQLFNGYLGRLENNRIEEIISSGGSYEELAELLMDQGILLDRSLVEFVILDNLYAEYYGGRYGKKQLEGLFEEMSQHASDEAIRSLAGRIAYQIQKLKPGKQAPGFSLPDASGMIYTLDSLRGSFTILAFGTCELPETQSELELLNSWVKEYEDRLQVVVIMLDDDFEAAINQAPYSKYDFVFLDGSSSEKLLDDYGIRYLPAFYFLDRESRLVLSPAVMPSENLRRSVISKMNEGLMDDV